MIWNLFCEIFVIIVMFSIDKINEVKKHISKVPTDKAPTERGKA